MQLTPDISQFDNRRSVFEVSNYYYMYLPRDKIKL